MLVNTSLQTTLLVLAHHEHQDELYTSVFVNDQIFNTCVLSYYSFTLTDVGKQVITDKVRREFKSFVQMLCEH